MCHLEIHHYYEPHRLQTKVPPEYACITVLLPEIFLRQSRLIQNRIACIKQCPVPEILLLRELHLDYIFFSAPGSDRNVKYSSPVICSRPQVLSILESHILNLPVSHNPVQECNQNILALLAAENPLEHIVVRQTCIPPALLHNIKFHIRINLTVTPANLSRPIRFLKI